MRYAIAGPFSLLPARGYFPSARPASLALPLYGRINASNSAENRPQTPNPKARYAVRIFVTAFLLLFLAGTVFATIPWTPEDAARAREVFQAGERVIPPPEGFRFSGDPLADYDLAASFIAGK